MLENRRERIINNYFEREHNQLCVILSGSDKDYKWVNKIRKNLEDYNIYSHEYVCSAHKKTKELMIILDRYNNENRNIIYITVLLEEVMLFQVLWHVIQIILL